MANSKLRVLMFSLFFFCIIVYGAYASEFEPVKCTDIPMPAPMIAYDQWGNIILQHRQYSDGSIRMYDEYAYDESGNLLKDIHYLPDNSVYSNEYVYNEDNICIKRITLYADGTTIEYINEYDGHGNLLRATASNGIVIEYSNEYDIEGRLLSIMDSNGEGRIYEYRDDGSYTVVHSSGMIEEYGSDGILDSSISSDGLFTTTYDDCGRRISEAHPSNDQLLTWVFSEDGKLASYSTYLQGWITVYEYDADGYIVKATTIAPDDLYDYANVINEYSRTGALIRQTYIYENSTNYTAYRDDGTAILRFEYDTTYFYNQDGYPIKRVFPEGNFETYRYDENYQLIGKIRYSADGVYTGYSAEYDPNCGYHVLIYDEWCIFKAYHNEMDNNITHCDKYQYDEECNLLSYEDFSVSEFNTIFDLY